MYLGVPGSGKTTAASFVSRRINALRMERSKARQQKQWSVVVPMDGARLAFSIPGCLECQQHGILFLLWPEDWHVGSILPGFHYTRKQLDAMPDPEEAHRRRGASWTFDAERFVAAIREIRTAGETSLLQAALQHMHISHQQP